MEVNRNILGKLISCCSKTGKTPNFEKVLENPLSPGPLSISFADGIKRSTQKSKLLDILLESSVLLQNVTMSYDVYIVDLMALVRTLYELPVTYEDLIIKLLKMIPKGIENVHIIADSYLENSIKNSERQSRGDSTKLILKSVKSKVTRDFKSFLSNSDNKNSLVDLFFEYFIENEAKLLNVLRSSRFFFIKI